MGYDGLLTRCLDILYVYYHYLSGWTSLVLVLRSLGGILTGFLGIMIMVGCVSCDVTVSCDVCFTQRVSFSRCMRLDGGFFRVGLPRAVDWILVFLVLLQVDIVVYPVLVCIFNFNVLVFDVVPYRYLHHLSIPYLF